MLSFASLHKQKTSQTHGTSSRRVKGPFVWVTEFALLAFTPFQVARTVGGRAVLALWILTQERSHYMRGCESII